MELTRLTIAKTHQELKKKSFSATELCEIYLDRIERKNKEIFAYLTICREKAFKQAKEIDDLIAKKQKIPLLAGIPFAIKDNILVQDVKCTAGSKILQNYIAPYDATVIKKLKEQKAVILGKANLDEFAMGSSCEYSAFGSTKNPHDIERVAGGSSGGSAAAVASQLSLASLGSDTCGSIRLPASFCGLVGLKPTYGRVSRYGLVAMASSFDQIGPITKTVEDAKIVFNAIKGKDPLDSTSVESKVSSFKFQVSGLKIGVPREYFITGIDKEVEKLIKEAIKKFKDLGLKIEEISLPHAQYALSAYYLITPSEVSANLARYDGIKYGTSITNTQNSKSKDLADVYVETRQKYLGEEVKRRIMLGTFALSAGYYEAYYLKAQKVRAKIKQDFEKAFAKVDFILTPVSSSPAFKLGEKTQNPIQMYLTDIFAAGVNLAGLPAISIPCGKVGHLPVGFQIIGNTFEEDKILKAGMLFEKNYGND